MRQAGDLEQAAALFRAAVDRGLKDQLLFRAMWDLALCEKKLGREPALVAVLTDLTASPNPHRADAYEELAKYFEHKERNPSMALEMTRCALRLGDSADLRKRESRLAKRSASPGTRRLSL